MANLFDAVKANNPKRSAFDLSHERKLSMNMGDLVPILCQEVVPGDRFRVNTENLMRLAPLTAPMMHRVNVFTHFFFVPNRLVFAEFQNFITGGEDGHDETLPPFIHITNALKDKFKSGSLADYMGLPSYDGSGTISNETNINAIPFRAYQMIFNEYYRDENLIDKVDFGVSPGQVSNASDLLTIRKRAWEKDYFTSALPWTQKGDDVTIPITGDAPVIVNYGEQNTQVFMRPDGSIPTQGNISGAGGYPDNFLKPEDANGDQIYLNPGQSLMTDLSNVSSSTINDLRKAFQLQKWLERNARAGSRYTESILAHFGVRSSDARLQRPEYLGGGKNPIVISEVLQTSSTDTTSPQGHMAGHGIGIGNSNSFSHFFEEHGFIIGIMSVLPRTSYQQGIPKQFFKFDKFDYYWPEFANLGEQEVKQKELYFDFTNNEHTESVFGYQSRYCEYKYIPSTVHGDFRTSLLTWHMGRKFNNEPGLNASFINSDPTLRVFAVTDPTIHHLYVQIYHNIQAIRPMPRFGTPGRIDH